MNANNAAPASNDRAENMERVRAICKSAREYFYGGFASPFYDPLSYAVLYGTTEDVRAIIEHGNACVGMFQGADYFVDYYAPFLREGCNFEQHEVLEEAYCPLATAARLGKFDVVKYLVAHGADVECTSYKQWCYSALFDAVASNELEIAAFLLDNGADIETKAWISGDTPIIKAAREGFTEMTRLLLSRGANVHAEEASGHTALFRALSGNDKEEIVLALLEAGCIRGITYCCKTLLRRKYPKVYKRFFGKPVLARKAKFLSLRI